MLILLLMAAGFVSSFQTGDACIDALHEMRETERMRIVSSEVLEDNVIAFTLADSSRIGEKTAILVCERDMGDDAAPQADPTAEASEPAETFDDTGLEETEMPGVDDSPAAPAAN